MNKKELVKAVAAKTKQNHVEISKAVDAIFDEIKEAAENGGSVTIKGFGSFTIQNHKERKGINPFTRELMTIPARKVMKFTPSKSIIIK